MANELVALKIKIGLKKEGAKYPNFNSLRIIEEAGIDWCYYVDRVGPGWMYDKKYGHKEEGVDSPKGMQWGVLLVPDEFAQQAIAAFPDDVSIIDETELESFHDSRVTEHLPDTETDDSILNTLKLELEYNKAADIDTTEIRNKIAKALDPDDAEPGVTRNKKKKWIDRKTEENIVIK